MPSPFVYRSLQSIRPGFSVGTLRYINSLSFFVSGIVFLRPMSTFCPFSNEFGEHELCMLFLTTGMCNPAHCPHTLCPMKCLVLAYSTIVTISMSDSDKFTVETPNCQPFTRGCDWGKLVPSSHKRGELRYTVI